MRIKPILFSLMFVVTISSCHKQEEKEPSLSYVDAIYCMPYNINKCLPLEIVKTANGWQAKYSGASSNQALLLKPRYNFDEYGDTIIVFDEYYQGKINGKYVFGNIDNSYFDSYQEISYISSNGKDTVSFLATIIRDGVVFIDQRNFTESVNRISNHPEGGSGFGTEERDVNLIYLMHNNPESFTGSYKGFEDLDMVDSPDKKLRIYRLYSHSGGNGLGATYNTMPAQYKTEYGVITLNDISAYLYNRLNTFSCANFPFEYNYKINQVTLSGKTYYMVEVDYNDPQPVSFEMGNESCMTDAFALFAFQIDKGRLKPAKIFEGESLIEIVFDNKEGEKVTSFKYNEKNKEILAPIVDNKSHSLTGKYREIKLVE